MSMCPFLSYVSLHPSRVSYPVACVPLEDEDDAEYLEDDAPLRPSRQNILDGALGDQSFQNSCLLCLSHGLPRCSEVMAMCSFGPMSMW